MRSNECLWMVLLLAAAGTCQVMADSVPSVEIIAAEGEVAPGTGGLLIEEVNSPFTNGNGVVGFVGSLDDGGTSDDFVWFGAGIIWRNSDALPGNTLLGAESTMGIADTGDFAVSVRVDSLESVWTSQGRLLSDLDPAPARLGMFISTVDRTTMLPDGSVYWISGLSATSGGPTTGRVLYRSSDPSGSLIDVVLESGEVVDGFTLDTLLDFDYQISDNGAHHIHVVDLATGSSTDDGAIYVDGAIVAQEASPAVGAAANWDNFDLVSINDDGDYVFSGDTDGPSAVDDFIAFNGEIVVRQGDELDGIALNDVRSLSINNLGQVAHHWGSPGSEALFIGDGSNLPASSVKLLAVGDVVDTDGDNVVDSTVIDLEASQSLPGLWLAEDGNVYLRVSLERLAAPGPFEAVIRVPTVPRRSPPPAPPIDMQIVAAAGEVVPNTGGLLITDLTEPFTNGLG